MRVGVTQFDIAWENKAENQKRARTLMEEAKQQKVDLLVFPEMTLTGFSMNTKLLGEEMLLSPTLHFFKECSKQYDMAMMFGYVEEFGEEYYNKCMLVANGKVLMDYDKIHPFSYGDEGKHYVGGSKVKTATFMDMVVSGFVCYDLRFPELFQAVSEQAQAIFVIANWPKERVAHWEALLKARAIENQCYIVGVNRIGTGNGLEYIESSMAFDPLGERLTKPDNKAPLQVVELQAEVVASIRKQFPFKQDRKKELYANLYF
ncbi:MAG: carbon-nitrogen family hydrolase [Eubacteriales bacterium]|nr:carbon-nitrogen family hydrolase [Eubacteriales bacterium]